MTTTVAAAARDGEVEVEPDGGGRRRSRQDGVALCLSGGGYRAALFHMGAVRRLMELGVWPSVKVVSAVSGGSIFAAHLARCMRRAEADGVTLGPANYEERVAEPFREFAGRDIRSVPVVRMLNPRNWFRRGCGASELERQYDAHLTKGMVLGDLPGEPAFTFCATDMAFGVNWVFTKGQVGDFVAGYWPGRDVPLARAVAASSCFPPVFRPMPMGLDPKALSGGKCPPGGKRDDCIRSLSLTDGGVYDNMGLEPVWKGWQYVLVSDGGAPFAYSSSTGLLGQMKRFTDIIGSQVQKLRTRWLMANFSTGVMAGTYWGVSSAVASYEKKGGPAAAAAGGPPFCGYPKGLAADVIARIRTDMDGFTAAEMGVLETHGYTVADAAVRTHVPELAGAPGAALRPPRPEWDPASAGAEEKVRAALDGSDSRALWWSLVRAQMQEV